MGFMQPQVTKKQTWIEIDGPHGTEVIPSDLCGPVPDYDGAEIPTPEAISDYCQNATVFTAWRQLPDTARDSPRRDTWIALNGQSFRPNAKHASTWKRRSATIEPLRQIPGRDMP